MLKTTGAKHSARIQGGLFADGEASCGTGACTLCNSCLRCWLLCATGAAPLQLFAPNIGTIHAAHCVVSSVCCGEDTLLSSLLAVAEPLYLVASPAAAGMSNILSSLLALRP